MVFSFEIPGTLPSLNKYIDDERTIRYSASRLKNRVQDEIKQRIPADAPHFKGAVVVRFTWIRPDMRTDKDNVAFAKKFILDALQEAHVISRDSWKLCTPYDAAFLINRDNPRTIVSIEPDNGSIRYEL